MRFVFVFVYVFVFVFVLQKWSEGGSEGVREGVSFDKSNLSLAVWIGAKQLRSPGAELPRYGIQCTKAQFLKAQFHAISQFFRGW